MRPNNEFTSPEQRFFYPVNHEIEHHDSLDVSNLPSIEHIEGRDHYVVYETADGELLSNDLIFDSYSMPAGAAIKQVVPLNPELANTGRVGKYVEPAEFAEVFDLEKGFTLDEQVGVQMIVQLDTSWHATNTRDARFANEGVIIVPQGEPLPRPDDCPVSDINCYRVLGFINNQDKLVLWGSPRSYSTLVVEWSVANAIAQNRLEEQLLCADLPREGDLVGMLSTQKVSETYLQYYDAKYGTNFMPKVDPRNAYGKAERFAPLTEAQRDQFRKLTQAARFMSNPR